MSDKSLRVLRFLWQWELTDVGIAENGQQMKIGRNEPCPCGSGEKYKNCCMGVKSGKPLISEEQTGENIDYLRKKLKKDPLKAMRLATDMMQSMLSHGLENWRPKGLQESFDLFLRKQATQLHEDAALCLSLYFEQLAVSYKAISDGRQELTIASRMNWWERTLTRSFFTEVEGVLFLVQKVVLWAVDRGEITIDSEEEMRNNIGNGPYLPMLKTFDISFSCFALLGQGQIDYQDNGWARFQRSHGFRNSFTHPRTTSDNALPQGYVEETLFPGMIWYHEQMDSLGILKCDHHLCKKSHHDLKILIASILPKLSPIKSEGPGPLRYPK